VRQRRRRRGDQLRECRVRSPCPAAENPRRLFLPAGGGREDLFPDPPPSPPATAAYPSTCRDARAGPARAPSSRRGGRFFYSAIFYLSFEWGERPTPAVVGATRPRLDRNGTAGQGSPSLTPELSFPASARDDARRLASFFLSGRVWLVASGLRVHRVLRASMATVLTTGCLQKSVRDHVTGTLVSTCPGRHSRKFQERGDGGAGGWSMTGREQRRTELVVRLTVHGPRGKPLFLILL